MTDDGTPTGGSDPNTDPGNDGTGDDGQQFDLDEGTGTDGESQSETPMTRDEITKLIADQGQRIADRQVNALMKEQRKNGGKQDGERTKTSDQEDTQSRHDVREARMAYREYLNDAHTFVDASERELAVTLGGALVSTGLAEHGDPDRAGRQAASQVSEQLSAYRKAVETATVNRLRKRGALITEPGRGGDSPPSGQAPAQSTTADLRNSARTMAQQFNQELGYPADAG